MTPHFFILFRWHVLRSLRRQRGLAVLNILSVALGIAVFLAIQIANHSANRSFAAGVDLVAGKSHLEIRGDIDELLWPQIKAKPGLSASTATVEGVITLPDFPGEFLRVVGVDVFTSEPFLTFSTRRGADGGAGASIEEWLGTRFGIAVNAEFARRHQLARGAKLRVIANAQEREAVIVSVLDLRDSPAGAQPRFALMDISWAQELFGSVGRLTSIQLRLDEPERAEEFAEALRALLPPDLAAEPPRQRSLQLQSMLSAFQLNLTALSMVSLLVGTFLVYNTISASVARRRTEIGILRALGATQTEVRALFLGEALLLGIAGVIAGAIGGVALAQLLLGAVAKTVSSLYLLVSIDRSYIAPWHLMAAAVFGCGAVLIGAWKPAGEAARIKPAHALSLGMHAEMEAASAQRLPWLSFISLALAAALAWLALHTGPAPLAFAAAFLVLAAFAFFSPAATSSLGRTAAAVRKAPVLWRLAADNLHRSVHRNAITVAALTAAVALAVSLVVMIHSFRESVSAWIERGIIADLFIAPASNETVGLGAFIPPAAIEWLRAQPDIKAVDAFREIAAPLVLPDGSRGRALLAVVQGSPRKNLQFTGGGSARKLRRVFENGEVAVTESFARRFGLGEGNTLTLVTPKGLREFAVAGVYSDYSRDQGVVLMAQEQFARFWDDPRVQSLAVYLRPEGDPQRVADAFEKQFSRAGEFAVYSNRELRARVFTIFEQTFAITHVLRTVAVIVAFAGIFLSVTTLVAERERELGMLRAIGASRWQIQRLLMIESAFIGIAASALGVAAGVLLAIVLTHVLNPAFFGWTIQFHIPWAAVFATPLWIVAAAALSAAWPARRATRGYVAAAVREE